MSVYKSCDNWFDFPAGMYCGLFVKEKTAKKLQKLLWRQTQEIKEFLTANKGNLLPMEWTLAYPSPDKEQTTVYFSDQSDSVDERIKLFDKACRMQHVDNGVFVSDKKWYEASKEVQAFYEEMYGEDGDGNE